MNTSDHGRYVILDGMRGIAALTVMVFHYTSHTDYELLKNAPVAVDLFFILSGFVLCFSYGDKIYKNEIGFMEFMLRRLIRLYPMLILGLLIGTIAVCLFSLFGHTTYSLHEAVASFGINALFLPYLNTGEIHH